MSTTTATTRSESPSRPGPRSPQAKSKVRLNAFKHGITAQVINMPPEVAASYLSFTTAAVRSLKPSGFLEIQAAQTIADCQWRLNNCRAWQMNLFAGHYNDNAGQILTDLPEVEAAFLDIQVVEKKSGVLKTISIYEQRINRIFESALKRLQELQKTRYQREESEMRQASEILKVHKMKGEAYNPTDDGFVFSNQKFEQFLTLEKHKEEVRTARSVHFDRKKFTAATQSSSESPA